MAHSKFVAIYGFTTSSCSMREVTTLQHEVWYDPVKFATLISQLLSFFAHPLLSSAQSSEVLYSFWDNISKQAKGDAACRSIVYSEALPAAFMYRNSH